MRDAVPLNFKMSMIVCVCALRGVSRALVAEGNLELKGALHPVFVWKGRNESGEKEGERRGDSVPDGRVWCDGGGVDTQEMGGSDTGGRTVGGVSSVLTCAPLVHEQCYCSVKNNKMRYLVDIA